ncbi:TniQ family protein [Nonomuraea polychroma]|uniref:TniQ family protein n=1 Tax=Nonomuraea polychroma TaxID=46176 RepID=UPI003D8E29EB
MAVVWPRRLALVVAPACGESFASWVDRMALRNGCPPWAMVEALGLDVRASGDVRSLAYGVVTTPETCRAIEAATGVSSETVREMHLEVFDGSVLDLAGVRVGDKESVRRAEGREWVQFFGSRVCPTCLAASGGVWSAWWKLGWAAVCPARRTLLVDLCPRCRDQLALTAGPTARERCGDLLSYQPGPLLSAAAMLIIDELSFTGSLLDALRYFMDQRRYDPWAGTLWHEYCDDYHPTAVTNRILNHLKIRYVDSALLKPLALWEPGAPHHLHPPETVEDLDLPEAALLLAGEGIRPWQTSAAVRASLKRVRA